MKIWMFALLALFVGTPALAATPAWTITETAGAVQIQKGASRTVAVRGATLAPGDAVATGTNGRAVLVRGQEYVVVSPKTRLRLPTAAEQPGGIVQIVQDFGRAMFRIEKKETPHFGVRTPYLVALVKGTTFTVDSGEAGASVAVSDGRVDVSPPNGGAHELVPPGLTAKISSLDPASVRVAPTAAAEAAAAAREVRALERSEPASKRPSEQAAAPEAKSTEPHGKSAEEHGRPAPPPANPAAGPAATGPAPAAADHASERANWVALSHKTDTPPGPNNPGNGNGNPGNGNPGNGNGNGNPGNGNGNAGNPGNGNGSPGNGNGGPGNGNGNPGGPGNGNGNGNGNPGGPGNAGGPPAPPAPPVTAHGGGHCGHGLC